MKYYIKLLKDNFITLKINDIVTNTKENDIITYINDDNSFYNRVLLNNVQIDRFNKYNVEEIAKIMNEIILNNYSLYEKMTYNLPIDYMIFFDNFVICDYQSLRQIKLNNLLI